MVESRRDRGSFWRARQSAVPTGCLKLAQEQGDDDPRVLECSNTIRCILDCLPKVVDFAKDYESKRNNPNDCASGVHDVLRLVGEGRGGGGVRWLIVAVILGIRTQRGDGATIILNHINASEETLR